MKTASPDQLDVDGDTSMRRGSHINSHVINSNKIRKKVGGQIKGVLLGKSVTRIGTWNVRTAYSTGKLAHIINEMKTVGLHILGIAELRWLTSGQLVSDEVTVLYSSGSKHERGVSLLLSKKATRNIVSWEPIS